MFVQWRILATGQRLAKINEQGRIEAIKSPGAIRLGDIQNDGDRRGIDRPLRVRCKGRETFRDRRGNHAEEFRAAPPGLFERNLAADDPFAALVDKASLGEAINSGADGGGGGGEGEADACHHSGRGDRDWSCGQGIAPSPSASSPRSLASSSASSAPTVSSTSSSTARLVARAASE